MSHELLQKQINACFSKNICPVHQLQKFYCCVLKTCILRGVVGCKLCLEQQKDHINHPLMQVSQIINNTKKLYLQRPQRLVQKQCQYSIQKIIKQKNEIMEKIDANFKQLSLQVLNEFNKYEKRIKQINQDMLSYENFVYEKQKNLRRSNNDLKQFIKSTCLNLLDINSIEFQENKDLIYRQQDMLETLSRVPLRVQESLQQMQESITAILNTDQNSNCIDDIQKIDITKIKQSNYKKKFDCIKLSSNIKNCIISKHHDQISITNLDSNSQILKNNLSLRDFEEIEANGRKIIIALDFTNQFNIICQKKLKLVKKLNFEEIDRLRNNQEWINNQINIQKNLQYDDETKLATVLFPQYIYTISCNLNINKIHQQHVAWLRSQDDIAISQNIKYNQFNINILHSNYSIYLGQTVKIDNIICDI